MQLKLQRPRATSPTGDLDSLGYGDADGCNNGLVRDKMVALTNSFFHTREFCVRPFGLTITREVALRAQSY